MLAPDTRRVCRKSSHSTAHGEDCIEVAPLSQGPVLLRDSKNPEGPPPVPDSRRLANPHPPDKGDLTDARRPGLEEGRRRHIAALPAGLSVLRRIPGAATLTRMGRSHLRGRTWSRELPAFTHPVLIPAMAIATSCLSRSGVGSGCPVLWA